MSPHVRGGPRGQTTRRRAFTLIEVMAAVAVIVLLVVILLPSLSAARMQTRSAVCLSNLRQMIVAAHAYGTSHAGSFPPYLDKVYVPPFEFTNYDRKIEYVWDFTRVTNGTTGQVQIKPGLLWEGQTIEQIHQCPSFKGPAMWDEDPYSGYNYNSSYVGTFAKKKKKHEDAVGNIVWSWEVVVRPAREADIRRPAVCAVFGDGEYLFGANKFMRSPWGWECGARDTWFNGGRGAGTQGYRHLKRTNAAFADGHAQSWRGRYTETYDFEKHFIGENTGFLSPGNGLYDLE